MLLYDIRYILTKKFVPFVKPVICHHFVMENILLTKTTATRNEVALSYHRVRGLYFQTVVFVATIIVSKHSV